MKIPGLTQKKSSTRRVGQEEKEETRSSIICKEQRGFFIPFYIILPAITVCCSLNTPAHLNFWQGRAMISEDQAREVICEFIKGINEDRGMSPSEVKAMLSKAKKGEKKIGEVWSFDSRLGKFVVSILGGYVSEYGKRVSEPKEQLSLAPEQDPIEMQDLAERMVQKIYPEFSSQYFELARVSDPGHTISYYYWQRKWGDEVSIYHDYISITIRTDDKSVKSYIRRSLPFRRTVLPRVTEREARRIVKKRFYDRLGTIDRVSLMELPVERANRSITVWYVSVTLKCLPELQDNQRCAVRHEYTFKINADSGEMIKEEN